MIQERWRRRLEKVEAGIDRLETNINAILKKIGETKVSEEEYCKECDERDDPIPSPEERKSPKITVKETEIGTKNVVPS